jgi:hypothetical protein
VVRARYEERRTGSVFTGTKVGASLEDLLRSAG